MKNNLVQVVNNVWNTYAQTITLTMVDKVLKFQSTLGNGAQEMVSDEWLNENFCTLYKDFYKDLHDEVNIDTKLDLPEDYIDTFSNCEMDDSAGLEMNQFESLGMGCPVKVMCKGEATCAFSIIANLCYHLTDKKAGDFLRKSSTRLEEIR
eukprot:7855394-Ditylum_brightwellii.AAC.1